MVVKNLRLAPAVAAALIVIVALSIVSSCGTARKFTPDDPHWRDADTLNIADPGKTDPSLEWQTAKRTVFDQGEELLDIDRNIRIISGNRKEAYNINSFDEVPNSTWFTNRLGMFDMTTEELIRGVATTSGPDASGEWTIFRTKVQGVTPGLFIQDVKGDRFILKFDPIGHPEMATGAAAMATRFLHAAGYNVPQETIIYWHPDRLRFKDGLMFKDKSGIERPFTQQDLQDVLDRIEKQPDGTIRSLASKFLPNVRGPFEFDGVRDEDPNDWCPHQHRRELRALYVFCSMINHWDIKDQNTMDILVTQDSVSYLKHYLLDFGSTFGSAGNRPQDKVHGYANLFDLKDMLVSIFTLGMKKWQWEDAKPWTNPTVGYYESEIFHPAKWDPIYPIPAFENMTKSDAFWAAKIVMAFSDDHLRALVESGEYTDPEVREMLFDILKERRDKIGRHWFSKVSPLDNFRLRESDTLYNVTFEDLSLTYNLADSISASYKYRIRYGGKTVIDWRGLGPFTKLPISKTDMDQMVSVFKGDRSQLSDDDHLYKIEVVARHGDEKWRKPVVLWLWYHPDRARFQLVGIEHTH